MSLSTLMGALVEIFLADLAVVVGLALQKVAVMRNIEHRRILRQQEAAVHRFRSDEAPHTAPVASMSENAMLDVPLLLPGEFFDDLSETMTVASAESTLEEDVNDTQLPETSELVYNCHWLLGLAIFILGNALELLAMTFTSQSNVALLSNFTLLWNAFFSVWIFNERFHIFPTKRGFSYENLKDWDAMHCFILLVGSMVAVLFTPEVPEDDLTAKELLRKWAAPPYSFWGGFMVLAMFATSIFLVQNWRNLKTGNLNAALVAGLCGFVAAFCATLSKVATTLVVVTAKGRNQFNSPETVFLVSLWICMLISQLALLNIGLGAFEQGLVVPIFEIVGTLASIISGILFYRTYTDFSVSQWVGFGFGVFFMSWGVYLVAHREVRTQQALSQALHSNFSAADLFSFRPTLERRTRSEYRFDEECDPRRGGRSFAHSEGGDRLQRFRDLKVKTKIASQSAATARIDS